MSLSLIIISLFELEQKVSSLIADSVFSNCSSGSKELKISTL